jgi:hypothetical protein
MSFQIQIINGTKENNWTTGVVAPELKAAADLINADCMEMRISKAVAEKRIAKLLYTAAVESGVSKDDIGKMPSLISHMTRTYRADGSYAVSGYCVGSQIRKLANA